MISRMAGKIHKIHTGHHPSSNSHNSPSTSPSPSLAPSIVTTRTSLSDDVDVLSSRSNQGVFPIPISNMQTRADDHSPLPPSLTPPAKYRLGDFQLVRTLGTGSFGRVHQGGCFLLLFQRLHSKHDCLFILAAHHVPTNRYFAMKVLPKEKVVRTNQVEHTRNERRLLENVHNPFVVNVWGAFQDCSNLYIVMDFVAGGELFTLLRRARVRRILHSFVE